MLFIHNLDQWTLVPTSWLKRLSSSSPSPLWSGHLVVWRRGGDLSYASPRSGGKWGHHPSGAVPTVRLDHRRHIFNLYQRQGCKQNIYKPIRCQTLTSSFCQVFQPATLKFTEKCILPRQKYCEMNICIFLIMSQRYFTLETRFQIWLYLLSKYTFIRV